jgi:hypothetical protein
MHTKATESITVTRCATFCRKRRRLLPPMHGSLVRRNRHDSRRLVQVVQQASHAASTVRPYKRHSGSPIHSMGAFPPRSKRAQYSTPAHRAPTLWTMEWQEPRRTGAILALKRHSPRKDDHPTRRPSNPTMLSESQGNPRFSSHTSRGAKQVGRTAASGARVVVPWVEGAQPQGTRYRPNPHSSARPEERTLPDVSVSKDLQP